MRLFGLVPAAGSGARMMGGAGALPKQLCRLGARTMLEHAVAALLADRRIAQLLVVVAPGASAATRQAAPGLADPRVQVAAVGGATRAASVRAGLAYWLATGAKASDRVLVHDAARPCLAAADLARLIDECADDPAGGVLAVPLADTLKRAASDGATADAGAPPPGSAAVTSEIWRVAATVDRRGLWRAQTPQLCPIGALAEALDRAGSLVTDEAAALEQAGLHPRLVAGADTNLKVTRPADWALAEAILRAQGRWC